MSNKTPGLLTLLEKSIKQNAKICEEIKELVNFSAKEKTKSFSIITTTPSGRIIQISLPNPQSDYLKLGTVLKYNIDKMEVGESLIIHRLEDRKEKI